MPSHESDARRLTVYWCPRCEIQTSGMHHMCEKGPPLFPQLDEYTTCEQITVVPIDAVKAWLAKAPAVTVAAFEADFREAR